MKIIEALKGSSIKGFHQVQCAFPVTGIHLWRDEKWVYVEVEYRGKWHKVITEYADSNFSHIIEPLGIAQEIQNSELVFHEDSPE